MRYVCLVYHTPEAFAEYGPADVGKAKSLRVRGGRATVVDGPFAETKEHLVGFILVQAQDEAEALKLAQGIPLARTGTIELRSAH